MKTVLVSGASGIVGYGILRSLRATESDLRLIGTSIYDDSVAPAFCDIFELAPRTDDPEYIQWLINIIDRHSVDLLIPGIEIDLYTWSQYISKIKKTGAEIVLNNPKLIALCQDKWIFYQELDKCGVSCRIETLIEGRFDNLVDRFGLPFLLKPRRGFASKGIIHVTNREIFRQHEADIGGILMIQPLVGDNDHEYSASAFCDGLGGVSAVITLKRNLSKEGFTEKAEVVFIKDINTIIEGLSKYFLPLGPTNFQFRYHSNAFRLLEINPRISSATSIRTAFGYNESQMAVNYFVDGTLPNQPSIRSGKAVRYTEDAVFFL